jgi:hypothetical protein
MAFAAFGVPVACSARIDSQVVLDAVARFHTALNERDSLGVHGLLAQDARQTTSQQQIDVTIEAIVETLGRHKESRTIREIRMNSNSGRYIAITLESTFANGVAQEHLVWRVTGQQLELSGYSARSALLPTVARLGVQRE